MEIDIRKYFNTIPHKKLMEILRTKISDRPKRLEKFGLKLQADKLQIIPAGRVAAFRANQSGKPLPTFNFLGFTCYWSRSRKGFSRLKFTSRKDCFAAKLKGLRGFLRKNLNADRVKTLKTTIRVIKGWVNYHGVSDNRSDNQSRVSQFIRHGKRIIHKWLNRQVSLSFS